jgi:hypothetical protein
MKVACPPKQWFPAINIHGATTKKITISISLLHKPCITHQEPLWTGNNAVDTSL